LPLQTSADMSLVHRAAALAGDGGGS